MNRRDRGDIQDQLTRIECLVIRLLQHSNLTLEMEIEQMTTTKELLDEIGRQTTVEQGLLVAFEKVQADLLAKPAVSEDPETVAAINEAFNRVKANTDAMAAKLIVNTPADTGAQPTPAEPATPAPDAGSSSDVGGSVG